MARIEVITVLLSILLMSHHVIAVINQANLTSSPTSDNDKSDSVAAEDRISSSYGLPADSYGPPPSTKYKGPAPVYGPPELTGDYRPPQTYEPLPPEQPPPLSGPPKPFYSPSKPKQHDLPKLSYGPPPSVPKSSYGPPKSQYRPPKSQYGPPKSQYGPPKSSYGPPPSFKIPKPEYGPPSKPRAPPSSQYGPPSGGFESGPSIPLSVEAYGPPTKQSDESFSSKPQDSYGAPPVLTAPQQQYGAPNDLNGPPPPPPPGVPAPPTPPDIKYDGWQPIAGHVNTPDQQQPPINDYAPPALSNDYGLPLPSNDYAPPAPSNDYGAPLPSNDYGPPVQSNDYSPPPQSDGSIPPRPSNEYGPPSPSTDYSPPVPDNTYGPPSFSNSFGSSLSQYGPPASGNSHPPSNQYGTPLNNNEASFSNGAGSDNGQSVTIDSNPNVPSDSYGTPLNNPEDHHLKSIVSHATISHESDGLPPPNLPQFEPLHNNQKAIDSSSSNNVELHQPDNHYGLPDADIVKTVGFKLLPNFGINGDGNGISGRPSGSYGAPPSGSSHSIGGDDFSLQKLPAPSGNHGPSSATYGAPPFSSGASFSSSHSHRGVSHFGLNFHKGNGHHRNRHRTGLRPPAPPPSGFTLPKRQPVKFRDSIPAALISNIHKYLSPVQPPKTYGAPSAHEQQLPGIKNSSPFHGFSKSVATSNSFSANTVLAAPNVNYGTPLSFNDFNTPAPSLTYGAPNFVPPSSLGNGGNLYQSVGTSLAPTYGTPLNNAHGSDCQRNGGNFQYNFGSQPLNFDSLNQQNINIDYRNQAINSDSSSLTSAYAAPSVNELALEHKRENPGDLKDSYGNPVDNNFGASDQSGAALATHLQTAELSDLSSHSQNSLTEGPSRGPEGLSAEALTAALTAQGYGEAKNIVQSSEVDATQFLKSVEGGQALALAQTLTADGDGFQIQGSRGTYTLQIQPADGGLGTENSDGNVRHDQVLSNGLLQNILSAIEQQPEAGHLELQRLAPPQQQGYGHDLSQSASSSIVSNVKGSSNQEQPKQLRGDISPDTQGSNDQDSAASDNSRIALFFNQGLHSANAESRSVSKDEKQAEVMPNEKQSES
ncbi:trithorax group protein osa-like [Copidosoma floridanum]|uniref:trithorax group protein osa-like n=1 Tax=Copidosoma floridanum TaxID=29053 RepID=UPI0006C9BDA0|nr:trithorax group protein osa-like [Copidosoma floridanum]